jgi:hypothetical protein
MAHWRFYKMRKITFLTAWLAFLVKQVISRLKNNGFNIKQEMTIKKIAMEKNKSPMDIYDELK